MKEKNPVNTLHKIFNSASCENIHLYMLNFLCYWLYLVKARSDDQFLILLENYS